MNNIRVYINDTEVGYYNIEDTGVTFTWQAKLINEINSFSTTTTKTITLPLTKTLDIALKSPAVIDTTDSVSNREYFRIDITWNDTVVIKGYIKLQKVVILENDEYIEFSLEPREKDWITQFKDFTLTQLDFTVSPDQTHTLTYANIITSETLLAATREYVYAPVDIAEIGRVQVIWVVQSGGNTDFYYLGESITAVSATFVGHTYGFTNDGLHVTNQTFTTVADAFWDARGVHVARATGIPLTEYYNQWGYLWSNEIDYWQVSDFVPSIRHNAVVERCFKRIGYQVTIDDTDNYFSKHYNFVHNVEQQNKFESERNKLKVRVQAGGFSYTKTATQTWITPFRNLTDTGLITSTKFDDTDSDDSGLIDTLSNFSRYEVDEDCVLGFKWNFKIRHTLTVPVTVPTTGNDVSIYIKQYDTGGVLRRTVTYDIVMNWSNYSSQLHEGIMSGIFYMESGDYVECYIEYKDLWTGGATIEILDTNTFETEYYQGGNYTNKTIRLNEYLPDRTAYDYIKDLSFINNWEFYTNEKLKHVYIVREDLKRTGKQIDFKQKLNKLYPVELEEVGNQWAKRIYFNWLKDDNDWCVKVVENNIRQGLGDTYSKDEIEKVARFGVGLITNLNLFTQEVQELSNNIYAASLDKFEQNNGVKFNTVEMKGEETWDYAPIWKRVDYEPRYLKIYFGEIVEDEGIGGATNSITYSIDGNPTHTTYPRPEFGEPLHYGDATGLLVTKYAKKTRAIKYGWIFRAKFVLTENDVDTFIETYEDNNFRGDYELKLKGTTKIGELLKVNDFSPLTSEQTEIEFVIYRDDL